MLRDLFDELDERLQLLLKSILLLPRLVLLDLFSVDGAQPNEELADHLHVLLAVVGEGGLHRLPQELGRQRQLECLQRLSSRPSLKDRYALAAKGHLRREDRLVQVFVANLQRHTAIRDSFELFQILVAQADLVFSEVDHLFEPGRPHEANQRH